MSENRAPRVGPFFGMIVGALFILIALLRPAFLWNFEKVRLGREWLGDGGLSACFIALGVALAVAAALLLFRRRSP